MNPSNNPSSAATPKSPPPPPHSPPSPSGSSDPGGTFSEKVREKAQETKSGAAGAAAQLKEKAGGAAHELKQRTAGMAEERRQEMADRIGDYSSSIRDTAHSVENDDPNIAWFTERAADRLQDVADYVRQCNFHQLRDDAENLARRHPAVALSGLFITGLLLGSALKIGRKGAEAGTESASGAPYEPGPGMMAQEPMGSPVATAPETSQI